MSKYQLQDELLGNGNTKHYKIHPDGLAFTKGMTLQDGTIDSRETPDELCDLLSTFSATRRLIRVFYGSADGESWLDEHDIAGHVGRSMGSIKLPLLVPPGADGGGAMLDYCIVRLDLSRLPGKPHVTNWQHANFHLPNLELETGDLLELPYEVWLEKDGKRSCQARFFTLAERKRYLDLVTGKRFPDAQDFASWKQEEVS